MELVRPDWEPHDRLASMMRTHTSGLKILRWRWKAWELKRRRLNHEPRQMLSRRRDASDVDQDAHPDQRTQNIRTGLDEQPYRNVRVPGVGRSWQEYLPPMPKNHRRLYREQGFIRFEDYCRKRWHISRRHGNRMIVAAAVANNLTPMGVIPKNEARLIACGGVAATDSCRHYVPVPGGCLPMARCPAIDLGASYRVTLRNKARQKRQGRVSYAVGAFGRIDAIAERTRAMRNRTA
jgi:hypothetical protein